MLKGLAGDASALYSLLMRSSKTPLSKLPTAVKAALLAASIALTPLSSRPEFLAALACLTASLSIASRNYSAIPKCVKGVKYLLAVVAAASTASTIMCGGGVAEALINSGLTCLRMVLLLTCFSLVTTSVSLSESLRIARKLGIPKQVTYSLILAVRFIPLILYDLRCVTDSLMLKGVELSGGIRLRVKVLKLILESLVIILTYRIDRVTESIELRRLF